MERCINMLCSAGRTSILLLVFVVVLLILSAFFSCFETAFTSANSIRIKNMADENVKGARKALYLSEKFDKTLTTILIGNNLVNIANTTICAYLFSLWIVNPTLANLLNTLIVTIVVLIFGEILPKSFAKLNPEKTVLKLAPIMLFASKVLYPISYFFFLLQSTCLKKVKKIENLTPTVTEDELESIIDTMHEEGVINGEDADLIQGVLDLGDRIAYDIMTPRVDVTAIKIDDDSKHILEVFFDTMYSRLPVYDKDIDHIIGILNQKDYFATILKNEFTDLKSIITEPLFINENMKVDDIIRKMQKTKKHMAIVLDEHGGTSGIVSMEDAIEEMIGEIYDEHDDVIMVDQIKKLKDNVYLVDAETSLDDLFEELEIEHLPETEYNSLGGYLFALAEQLPQINQSYIFKTIDEKLDKNGLYIQVPVELNFTITRIKDRRIREVRVEVLESETKM